MQLLIDIANNKFCGSDCDEDEMRILSAFSVSKKSTRAAYLTSGTQRGDPATKKGGDGVKNSEYLTSNTKKIYLLAAFVYKSAYLSILWLETSYLDWNRWIKLCYWWSL